MAENNTLKLIPTKASLRKQHVDFQAVCFRSYKPTKRKEAEFSEEVQQNDTDNTSKDLNIKRLKQEIRSFTVQHAENKTEAKKQLAIKLGAKPPKNKYKNYKLLIADNKKQKMIEQKRLAFQQLGKNSHGKSNAKGKSYDRKRKMKDKGDILGVYGKVAHTD